MTPDALARIHAAAFTRERPWTAREFDTLLSDPLVTLHARPHGFALTRTVAGESELLTLAVDPAHQRQGIARALLAAWLDTLDGHAEKAFLEVAADNTPAVTLYKSLGFAEVGRRKAYYARPTAPPADALIMARAA